MNTIRYFVVSNQENLYVSNNVKRCDVIYVTSQNGMCSQCYNF